MLRMTAVDGYTTNLSINEYAFIKRALAYAQLNSIHKMWAT